MTNTLFGFAVVGVVKSVPLQTTPEAPRSAPLFRPSFIAGHFGAILISQSATLSKETGLALLEAKQFLDPSRYASISSEVSQQI